MIMVFFPFPSHTFFYTIKLNLRLGKGYSVFRGVKVVPNFNTSYRGGGILVRVE